MYLQARSLGYAYASCPLKDPFTRRTTNHGSETAFILPGTF
jgi:hypothetical protein